MKFSKPALPVEEQVALLVRRGMIIPDQKAAAEHLRHVNYYRLRAYWLPFEVKASSEGDHKFADKTSFELVVSLYDFDRRLRSLVLAAIEEVEVSLRTAIAYTLCLKYGSHPQLRRDIFQGGFGFDQLTESIATEVERSKETFIEHYKNNYSDPPEPPLWAVVEVMSLGVLSRFYESLEHYADRRAVAKGYGLNEKVLESALHHLSVVRNICAHHCRLWNRSFVIALRFPEQPPYLNGWFNQAERRNLYNTLVILGYLLKCINPGTQWIAKTVELIDSCPVPPEVPMGFPNGWRKLGLWTV